MNKIIKCFESIKTIKPTKSKVLEVIEQISDHHTQIEGYLNAKVLPCSTLNFELLKTLSFHIDLLFKELNKSKPVDIESK